ncbi:MAG TPA: hypothetical protein VN616_04450, partial [Puia sp.]|nr:hypothetical protein [Puia sp.]
DPSYHQAITQQPVPGQHQKSSLNDENTTSNLNLTDWPFGLENGECYKIQDRRLAKKMSKLKPLTITVQRKYGHFLQRFRPLKGKMATKTSHEVRSPVVGSR